MRGRAGAMAFLCALAGAAEARTLVVDVESPAAAGEIAMYFDKRLTFVLPEDVKVAVPGSADVLSTHVRGNLVVASLVDSPFVRETRPQTNLTIVTDDDTSFTTRIRVAESVEAAAVDLVRVVPGERDRLQVSDDAVRLVRTWLELGPAALEPSTAERLEALGPLVEVRARRRLAGWAATEGFELLADDDRRTKRGFIYLTSHGLLRFGPHTVLHLSAVNHSQRAFTVGSVRVLAGGIPVHRDALNVELPEPVITPDGRARGLGVVFTAEGDPKAPVEVEVCERSADARCVRVDVR